MIGTSIFTVYQGRIGSAPLESSPPSAASFPRSELIAFLSKTKTKLATFVGILIMFGNVLVDAYLRLMPVETVLCYFVFSNLLSNFTVLHDVECKML